MTTLKSVSECIVIITVCMDWLNAWEKFRIRSKLLQSFRKKLNGFNDLFSRYVERQDKNSTQLDLDRQGLTSARCLVMAQWHVIVRTR